MEVDKQKDERKDNVVCQLGEQSDEASCSIKQVSTKVRIKSRALKQKLVDIYRQHCSTSQVSPMLEDEDLLKVYQQPSMTRVPYYQAEDQPECSKVSSYYQDLFCYRDKLSSNIYITGESGTGKTSFCKRMCLLWCMAQLQLKSVSLRSRLSAKLRKVRHMLSRRRPVQTDRLQVDIDYMKQFDFGFYVSLCYTSQYNVINMIEELLLYDYKDTYRLDIERILEKYKCVILLDALDEWSPKALDEWSPDSAGGTTCHLPQRNHSAKCVHITTCRPYRIENVRLSYKDIDSHVQISGIEDESSTAYVKHIVDYMNLETGKDRQVDEFMSEVKTCGLEDQLCIPVLSSHLVILWFDTRLTGLPRATIYANSLEMLFERAERRDITGPASSSVELHLPECLSKLKYCNKHSLLLYKVCLLSFKSLFKHGDHVSSLVFTSDQLQSEPFNLSDDEQQYLCRIGVLSKNEVFGCSEKQKLSFIHKSYLDFLAAMFTVLDGVIIKWSSLQDLLQFENYIVFLAGLSPENVEGLFGNIHSLISDELSSCRTNAIFHYNSQSYKNQIMSLQTLVIKCSQELSRSNVTNLVLQLEDFIFDHKSDAVILRQLFWLSKTCVRPIYSTEGKYSDELDKTLRELLLLNTTCVKSVYSDEGKFYDEFDEIKNLQCLHVGEVLSEDVVKFTKCMLNNQSTLHTVCIEDSVFKSSLLPELPVKSLHQLTSLSLRRVLMQHDHLRDLLTFLSDNVLMEHVKLWSVYCDQHRHGDNYRYCILTLNLQNHTKLTSLNLFNANIECKQVNTSSLKSVSLDELNISIVYDVSDISNCNQCSQLEYLCFHGDTESDDETVKSLMAAVKTLRCLKFLKLSWLTIPDDALLELHPEVTQVKIDIRNYVMSRQWFHCFINSCVNMKSAIKVELEFCKIVRVDGDARMKCLSYIKSIDNVFEYLTSLPTINITYKDRYSTYFEMRGCQ